MSKAVLVMNMPESCSNCPCAGNNYGYNECELKEKRLAVEDIYEKRPSWCPLRELPQKITSWKGKSTNYQQGHRDGYNACIDEILKGSE